MQVPFTHTFLPMPLPPPLPPVLQHRLPLPDTHRLCSRLTPPAHHLGPGLWQVLTSLCLSHCVQLHFADQVDFFFLAHVKCLFVEILSAFPLQTLTYAPSICQVSLAAN